MIDVEFMKLFWPIAAIHPGPKGTWLSAAGSNTHEEYVNIIFFQIDHAIDDRRITNSMDMLLVFYTEIIAEYPWTWLYVDCHARFEHPN